RMCYPRFRIIGAVLSSQAVRDCPLVVEFRGPVNETPVGIGWRVHEGEISKLKAPAETSPPRAPFQADRRKLRRRRHSALRRFSLTPGPSLFSTKISHPGGPHTLVLHRPDPSLGSLAKAAGRIVWFGRGGARHGGDVSLALRRDLNRASPCIALRSGARPLRREAAPRRREWVRRIFGLAWALVHKSAACGMGRSLE